MTFGLALLLALLPGATAFWVGRAVRAQLGDPALPERLAATRRVTMQASLVALVLLCLLFATQAPWAAPLAILSALVGGFPTRKAVLGERWGLVSYLAWMARVWTALGGFWILLAATPSWIHAAGDARPWAQPSLAALLIAWAAGHSVLLLGLLGARPLEDRELMPRFAAIQERSRVPPIAVCRAGPAQGRWVNAFALPAFRRPRVLLTDDLLAAFEPDETAAVFGHEVAHLEHYDRRRLVLSNLAAVVVIGLGVGLVPQLARAGRLGGVTWLWLWPLLLITALAVKAARHKRHEAESDRRGVELSGDAEALCRALVKLHELSRMPRRWDAEVERGASHPSLAHRLQAIRAAAGSKSDLLTGPVVVRSSKPGSFVVLDADRGHWLDGVPAATALEAAALRERAASARSVLYSELTALHLRAGALGPLILLATDKAGHSWKVPLGVEDIAAVQSALDRIDPHLTSVPPKPFQNPALSSLVCAAASLLLLAAAQVGPALIPALVGMFKATPPVLAALGAAGLASAALGARSAAAAGLDLRGATLMGLAAVAAIALGIAIVRSRQLPTPWHWTAVIVATLLGMAASFGWAGIAWGGLLAPPGLRLHQAALARPSAVVALLGLSAMLGLARRARAVALLLGVLSLLPLGLGSQAFARRFVRDPLWSDRPATTPSERALNSLARVSIGSAGAGLRLSPSGLSYALRVLARDQEDDADFQDPGRFRVGALSGEAREIEATDLAFLDDARLVRLTIQDGTTALDLVTLDAGLAAPWHLALPQVFGPLLEVDSKSGAWRLGSMDYRARLWTSLSGAVGTDRLDRRRLELPAVEGNGVATFALGRDRALGLRRRFDASILMGQLAFFAPVWPTSTELWEIRDGSRRKVLTTGLEVRCAAPPLGVANDAFICMAASVDDRRTTLYRLRGDPLSVEAMATFEGRAFREQLLEDGRVLFATELHPLLLFDSGSGTLQRLVLPEAAQPIDSAVAGGRVATVAFEAGGSLLMVSDLP